MYKFTLDSTNIATSATTSAGIPPEKVSDLTTENLRVWLSEQNLTQRTRVTVAGMMLLRSIDNNAVEGREVTLVTIGQEGEYPPHYHKDSDAVFIVISGEATFLSDEDARPLRTGDIVAIPRGKLHGFKLDPGQSLTWISVQYPPIYSPENGEDIHFETIPLKGLV